MSETLDHADHDMSRQTRIDRTYVRPGRERVRYGRSVVSGVTVESRVVEHGHHHLHPGVD